MNKYISKFVLMSAFAVAGTVGTTSCNDLVYRLSGQST